MNKKYSRLAKLIAFCLPLTILLFLGDIATGGFNNLPLEKSDSVLIQGRWDITINIDGKMSPSWLEVHHSGLHMLVGEFVGTGGSARPISRVYLVSGKMSFAIPPQWERDSNDLSIQGMLQGEDSLAGTITFSNGKNYPFTARRAPILRRASAPVWGKPIHLFDGTNLNQWHAAGENQWKAEGGIMKSPRSGSNLITNQTFNDFKLHIEFRYPAESNSGVYLRGRYEVQVIDSEGQEPSSVLLGGVYGFISPSEMVAKSPGEWQSFDITLIGRMVTIVANGKMIICNQQIPGVTGGALDSNEGEPGPILLQGDHGPIDYRNIIITPAK